MAVWSRFMAGLSAFREAYLNADPLQQQTGSLTEFDAFSRWNARVARYDLFWSLRQNNAFRDLTHTWSPALKRAFGLYQHTRNIFNPVNRVVEFSVAHIMGGRLDCKAGDGESGEKSALPICMQTENPAVRTAIATLWRHSRWQAKKSLWTRYGACLGDHALMIDDDPQRMRPTLRVIHPGHVKWVERDTADRVLSYILEESRYDPRSPKVGELNPTTDPRSTQVTVKYNEEAYIQGGKCVFKTFLNGAPYNWRGQTADGAELPAEWDVPYSFVPMVCQPHLDIGLPWGEAEIHSLLSKAFEVDDVASGLGDQIRKRIRAPKLLSGMTAPRKTKEAAADPRMLQVGDGYGNQADRSQQPFIFGPADARVHDMTNDLDVPGVTTHYQNIISEMERDYPELQMDLWATGDPSGRALRVARQRTENKIQERRTGYDAALVLAHKMALTIGAIRDYPGYLGLDVGPDPYDEGPLDHEIGHRPVFAPDPLDDIEEGSAFWDMAGKAVNAGMPLEVFLEREGWPQEDIDAVTAGREAQQQSDLEVVRQTLDAKKTEKPAMGAKP